MSDLNKEVLEELGFIQYNIPRFESPSCDECWQKTYRDEYGKKYFLDVKHYDIVHPTTKKQIGGYEVETQVYTKKDHNAINIKFLDGDVKEAEKFIETLFKEDLIEYYERYH